MGHKTATVKCTTCGKVFEKRACRVGENNFCSRACNGAHHKAMGSVEVTCLQCGKVFRRWKSAVRDRNFCDHTCQGAYSSQHAQTRINAVCDWCGKEFVTWQCIEDKRKHTFCSVSCCSAFQSKRTNPDRYKEFSDQSNALANLGDKSRMGDRTPKSAVVRKKIRETMLERYGVDTGYRKLYSELEHRWVIEGLMGIELGDDDVVHHIDLDKRNNDPDNLMVMSRSEHAALHKRLEGER